MAQREIPSWETVVKRNSVERLKQERFPTKLWGQWQRLAETPYQAVPEEDIVRLQWFGLYHDKPKVGSFMMRIKVPSGILAPAGLRAIGEIAREYGGDQGELTTRQNIQLHSITLKSFPPILERLRAVGLTTMGGCGDVVRNITGCPLAGIAQDELFDCAPIVHEAASFFYGNREYSDLPRKHKITIAACPIQCNAPEVNCIALVGTVVDGREGFAVRIGGGLSSTPRISRHLGVFVPRAQALDVLGAGIDLWRLTTEYRLSRVKARFKFMVDDYGVERLRALLEERLGYQLEDLAELPRPRGDGDHMGVHEQKQKGRFHLGFPVPLGLVTGGQMIALAGLAESLGGDIRLTRRQNLILAGIPEERLDETLARATEIGFSVNVNPLYGSSIGCIGEPHCNYAVTSTKPKLASIIGRLEREFGSAAGSLRIHLDGCPHACAQHWTGDIGLQGTTARGSKGEPLEAFDIILRGDLGAEAAVGQPVLRRVPSVEVEDYLVRLIGAYLGRRSAGETFRAFCKRLSNEELVLLAKGEPCIGTVSPSEGAPIA